MKIAHYIKTSLVDYEPNIASVVFTQGCNMTCPYCHNTGLMDVENFVEEEAVISHLKKRQGMLDAVVITGGEPTLHKQLPDFIRSIKKMGFKVKLDTNGTNPSMVRELIDDQLVDHIAMDIKGLPKHYEAICGISYDSVRETYDTIKDFGSYELRTTVYPMIQIDDLKELCRRYANEPYVLQQYRQMDASMDAPYEDYKILEIAEKYNVKVRNT